MAKKKITAIIHFEDNGQDFLQFKVHFDQDFLFGEVVDSQPFQASIWKGYYVLSGAPYKGQFLRISKGPGQEVLNLKHKISSFDLMNLQTVDHE